jgi:hypothetical protein
MSCPNTRWACRMKEDDAASLASRSHQQRKIWHLASESSVVFSVSSFNPLQLLYNFSPSTSLVSTRPSITQRPCSPRTRRALTTTTTTLHTTSSTTSLRNHHNGIHPLLHHLRRPGSHNRFVSLTSTFIYPIINHLNHPLPIPPTPSTSPTLSLSNP